MSWRLMEAVLDLRLPDEQERILVRLARYASDDGSRCFPGVALLSEDSGRSERSVQRTLRTLERATLIVPVAHTRGGRGRTTEYILTISRTRTASQPDTDATVMGDTGDTVIPEERVSPMSPIEPERVTPVAERVTPVAERVTPVVVKGDTRVTPIDHEQIKGTDQSTKTVAAEKKPLSVLSDDARTVLDDWRRKQGKTRMAALNPVQARELEDAVVDLGVKRLVEANTWAASAGVTVLIKAIRAARTKRKDEESTGPPTRAPTRNGSSQQQPEIERMPVVVRRY